MMYTLASLVLRCMLSCPHLATSCVQYAHWRAHNQAVLCLDVVPERNLIVAGSKDHNVSLWTLDGGQLGVLGEYVCVCVCVCCGSWKALRGGSGLGLM